MKWYTGVLLVLLGWFSFLPFFGQPDEPESFHTNIDQPKPIEYQTSVFRDSTSTLRFDDVIRQKFTHNKHRLLNFGITEDVIWIRVEIKNHSQISRLHLNTGQPLCDSITLFDQNNGSWQVYQGGHYKPFFSRPVTSPNYIFPFTVSPGATKIVYLKVVSSDPIQIPLTINTRQKIMERESLRDFLFGQYVGIVLIMILYNLFIYFTVKDKSYIYYIVYVLFVGLSQMVLKGYAFEFLWPNSTFMAKYSTIIIPVLSGVTTGVFMRQFLQTAKIVPKLNVGITVFIAIYILAGIIGLVVDKHLGFSLLQAAAFSGSIFALVVGGAVVKRGYKVGVFFLLAYSAFLLAVLVFVLSNFNLLPYNAFTEYVLEVGSTVQILLLSFALADKINIYRKEEEAARQEALIASKENERLVRDQNINLEKQVRERTIELKNTNDNLSQTLFQLKEAQSKLVESEKMVSLGQLTAGIAHEINNPINFVLSNVKPLELDIGDIMNVVNKYEQLDATANVDDQLTKIEGYKKEIDIDYVKEEIHTLLAGIKDGATRTAEIVRNLKNFARVDEANVKPANLNEGLRSTLMMVKNTFPSNFVLNKELGNIPDVECMPGKINQVFMNIITNGVQSIIERQTLNPDPGVLTIKTFEGDGEVKISIKDNGIGIKDVAKDKIFDPFYTTKPVGHGTGLGMSIVRGIIDSHMGKIELLSTYGEGAEFIITLPVKYLG